MHHDPNEKPTYRIPRITRRIHGHEVEEEIQLPSADRDADDLLVGIGRGDLRTATGGATGFARFAAQQAAQGSTPTTPEPQAPRDGRSGFARFSASQKTAEGDGESYADEPYPVHRDESFEGPGGGNDIFDDRNFMEEPEDRQTARPETSDRLQNERPYRGDTEMPTPESAFEMELFDDLEYDNPGIAPSSRRTILDDPGQTSSPNFLDEIDRMFPVKR